MAVANLTGTKWTFNETLSFESGNTWSINFNSVALVPSYMGGGEKTSFTQLKTELISYMGNACGMTYVATDDGMPLNVYQANWSGTYSNENSRIIEITGGADVENPDLIAFLEANAVMEVAVNLTGTKWIFNETIDFSSVQDRPTFHINFTSKYVNEHLNTNNAIGITISGGGPTYIAYYDYSLSGDFSYVIDNDGNWVEPTARTITITGGQDVENPQLVSFLMSNAVKVVDNLPEFLTNIADAIRTAKDTKETINAQHFAKEIKNITSVRKYLNMVGAKGFFSNMGVTAEKVEQIFDYNDTSNYDDFSRMFENCTSIERVPNLDFNNGKYFEAMFKGSGLKKAQMLEIPNILSGHDMFEECTELQEVDILEFPNGNSSMFSLCVNLTKLIIRTMGTIPELTPSTFKDCCHFEGTSYSFNGDYFYNPDGLKDGKIYVPDDKVEELKATEVWSDFADIIVPLSTLEE